MLAVRLPILPWLPTCLLALSIIYAATLITKNGLFPDHSTHATIPIYSSNDRAIFNSSWGFGEILFISIPERTDRQDAMHLMAAHSNISITHIPGINGSSIIEKAKPFRTKVTLNELGSWRAHANAWRRVMDAPYETALILEDDLDWDVNINDIMSLVSEHLPKSSPTDPWGHSSWDVLWLGACLNSPNPDLANEDVRYDDRWAPSRDNMRDYDKKYFDGLAQGGPYMDSGERVIQRAYKPVCTMAYAITKYAARKMLYNIGYRGLDGPVDLAMCWMHEKGQLKGWTVWPPLFMPWRVGGLHDSDIQSFSNGEDKGNEGGNSINLRDSIRKAMTKEYTSPAV